MGRLSNKVAIVTGGARGIGASFCEGLAAAGASVVVTDVIDGSAVVARIAAANGAAMFHKLDVTSQASATAAVTAAKERFGRVDILVNNAGMFTNLAKKPATEIEDAEWDAVMAVN